MKPWLTHVKSTGKNETEEWYTCLHPEAIQTKVKDKLWLHFGKKNGKTGRLSSGSIKEERENNDNKGQRPKGQVLFISDRKRESERTGNKTSF